MDSITQGIKLQEFFEKIDYSLLKEQKLQLLELMNKSDEYMIKDWELQALEGILSLIDSLQDTVVEVGIRSKEEVFNLTEDRHMKIIDRELQALEAVIDMYMADEEEDCKTWLEENEELDAGVDDEEWSHIYIEWKIINSLVNRLRDENNKSISK